MKRLTIFLVLVGLSNFAYSKQVVITFYGQDLLFEYDECIILKKKLKTNEKHLKKFYEAISKLQYQGLFNDLKSYRKELQLNDWLFYLLLDKFCNSIEDRKTNASYLKWFLLGKFGYKLQLGFSKGHASIFAESEDIIQGLPKYNKSYCLNCSGFDLPQHTFSRFNPYRSNNGKFSFFFNPLPKFLKTNYISKTFRLVLLGSKEKEEVEVKFDSVLMSCQHDINGFNLKQTFSVPLTSSSKHLLDRISTITNDYPDSIRVSYLMDFVVRNSVYIIDPDNKWAMPEEFLFYGTGDCEDRSSFMFYALKEILKKPVIIVEYPMEEHVNVAVSINLKTPPDFLYKGNPYYICETTTSRGFIPLGRFNLSKETKYKIIGEYNPDENRAGTYEKLKN